MIKIESDMNLSCLLYKMDEVATRLKSYRGDLMLDAALLASMESNAIIKGEREKEVRFIWQVREAGTCLHEIKPGQLVMIRNCAAWPASDFFLIKRKGNRYEIHSLTANEVLVFIKTETEMKP